MPASPRFSLRCLFAAFALLAAMPAPVSAASGTAEPWELCARHAVAAAAGENLPAHLLPAIAKVESGLWSKDRGELRAWPWTVTAEGKGRYLPTKAAAIAKVEALKARGIRNIDVGCLQVNLAYHPEAFVSLEEAFDPAANAAYAARFLAALRREANSWTVAIGHYHSRTPTLSNRYRLKVSRAWRAERHAANRTGRRQAIEVGVPSSRLAGAIADARIAAERGALALIPDRLRYASIGPLPQ
ncbi:MAG: transglycosylase SLT domain-containing protein [Kiloniellales bacterium]